VGVEPVGVDSEIRGEAMNCPDCERQMVGIEYEYGEYHYDGVSEWSCPRCGVRIGRWTGKRLKSGEFEPRYGGER